MFSHIQNVGFLMRRLLFFALNFIQVFPATFVGGNVPFGQPGNGGQKYYDSACIGSVSLSGDTTGFQFEFNCPEGRVIRIHKSISYSKPMSSGCPEYYDPDRKECCEYHEGKIIIINEPHREKTGIWPMRKQRRRSASR